MVIHPVRQGPQGHLPAGAGSGRLRHALPASRLPLWLKVGWTAWLAAWLPLYSRHYGPQNFLWFCDIANLAVGLALWLESPLLFSMQALSVLVAQALYTVDLAGRAAFGRHLLGGTEYVFDPAIPLPVRLAALFHVATPPLLLFALGRLGYHRRAFPVQVAFGSIVLAVSFLAFGPDKDLNWVWGPYQRPQTWMDPWLWFAGCLIAYPALLWWPTHLALSRWARPTRRPAG